MITLDQRILSEICEGFQRQEVIFAFLFGFRAISLAHSESDYDFAVFLGIDDPVRQFSIKKKLSARLPRIVQSSVDIIILDSGNLGIAFRALSEGTIIPDTAPEVRQQFAEHIFKFYPDYHIFQEKFLEDYRNEVLS